MKKALDFFTAHPARFFLLAALLWGGFMCFLNYRDGKFNPHDLLVEANGMVFDLLVFGILLSIYEALREKRDKIERLHEEIDDYRGWDEKEATYRIVGAVKRLNKLGISKIDLSECFLQNANLMSTNLCSANLECTNLQGANLQGANLQRAHLHRANLQGANLMFAHLWLPDLPGADLRWADLRWADLRWADLQKANLQEVDLQDIYFVDVDPESSKPFGANLQGANLESARVGKDWFEELEELSIKGREAIVKKYFIKEIIEDDGDIFYILIGKQ